MTEHEEWRPVVGYEGLYEVSNIGNVRTVEREVPHYPNGIRIVKSKILATCVGGRAKNYLRVKLQAHHNRGKPKHAYVHHLVAEAFHGQRPADRLVCHINDQGFDNRADNVYYGSRDDNEADRWLAANADKLPDAPF